MRVDLGSLGNVLNGKPQGHARRVAAFTMAIARHMGVPTELIESISRGAFLHDIGKVAIPDHLLFKTSALSPEEMAVMRKHSDYGYELVHRIPHLVGVADEIVYSHHERYDGDGYPRRLRGQEIPFGARIVAVANTLDSITSDLPYRQARTLEAARLEIRNCSGSQFDPAVVQAFQSITDVIFHELRSSVNTV